MVFSFSDFVFPLYLKCLLTQAGQHSSSQLCLPISTVTSAAFLGYFLNYTSKGHNMNHGHCFFSRTLVKLSSFLLLAMLMSFGEKGGCCKFLYSQTVKMSVSCWFVFDFSLYLCFGCSCCVSAKPISVPIWILSTHQATN